MKNFTLFALLISLLISIPASATTYRVNNNLTPIPTARLYASLATAQTAASLSAGDTLLVEGSGLEYDGPSIGIVKKLAIIGPGYFLTQNSQMQANSLPAMIKGLDFNAGSAGSIIIGLTFASGSTSYRPNVSTNNIAIIRCHLTYGINIGGSISGLLILQNYFLQYGITVPSSSYSFSNVILKNNIIVPDITISPQVTAPRIFSNVENNIFLGNVTLESNTFLSNIIAAANTTIAVTASIAQGNLIATVGQLPAPNNTLISNPAILFVGLAGASNSSDGRYRLPTNSPYLTLGFGGAQPGIFGGTEPYVLSGIPAIPSIYSLRGDAVGSIQNGLNITIGARVNP